MITQHQIKSESEKEDYLFGPNSLAYELGKRNLEFFCMYYLQQVFNNDEDSAEIAPVHSQIWEELHGMIAYKTHDKQSYVLPRGAGKSVFGNLSIVIFSHVYEFKKYTVVCSSIGSTAQKFVKQIKDAITDNPYIKHTFGTLVEPNNKKYIVNANNIELTNRSMIESISSTSSMRGRKYGNYRIELAILDDYQDENDVASPEQRDRKWKRFMDDVTYAMQKDNSTLIGLGTLQHPEDFYARLLKLPTWKSKVKKGVLVDDLNELFTTGKWGNVHDILTSKDENSLEKAKDYYTSNINEMQYPMLWDAYWDCFDMAIQYYEDPVSFEQEIQSNLKGAGEKRFRTIVTESDEQINSHDFKKTMLVIDPAGSRTKRKNKDYYAFAVGSISEYGVKYVRKGEVHRMEFDDYLAKTIQLIKDYPDITHVSIEKQVYSGADVIKLEQLVQEDDELKNRGLTFQNAHQSRNKMDKILTIVGDCNMGRIVFNEEDEEAIKQLSEFVNTDTGFDDFPDVVAEFSRQINDITQEVQSITFLPHFF